MIDFRFVGWNNIILILRKVIMRFLSPFKGRASRPFFGRVNVIGYELDVDPFILTVYVNYTTRTKSRTQ